MRRRTASRITRSPFSRLDAEIDRGGAIHRPSALHAETPQHLVVELGAIDRQIALVAVTGATPAILFAAAVAVGDYVVLAVDRMPAGADPSGRRHDRSRRTIGESSAAASAKISVESAITPVVAAHLVARLVARIRGFGRARDAMHRQQGQRHTPDQRGSEHPQQPAAGGTRREPTRQPFNQVIHAPYLPRLRTAGYRPN